MMASPPVSLALILLVSSLTSIGGQVDVDDCTRESMIPIRAGSKYLMPKDPKGLADIGKFTITDISILCHYPGPPPPPPPRPTPDPNAVPSNTDDPNDVVDPKDIVDPVDPPPIPLTHPINLEMVSIRHYQDWISIQNFMRNDDTQWITKPEPQISSSSPPDQSHLCTGMRYVVAKDKSVPRPNAYAPEEEEEEAGEAGAFFVWDTDDKSDDINGAEKPQPNADEEDERSVDLIFRQAYDQQDTPVRHYFIAARDKKEDYKQSYRFICQFPKDSDCYKNSNEEKALTQEEESVSLKDLIWTTRAMFTISTRPVSFAQARTLCSEGKEGLPYQLWNGVLAYTIDLKNSKYVFDLPKPIPPNALISSESEALELGDAILEHFLELELYPYTPFFASETDGKVRKRLTRPPKRDQAVNDGHFVMINSEEFKIFKNVDAFVLCTHPLKEVCLP